MLDAQICFLLTRSIDLKRLLYGNFGEKFPPNGTGIFFGTENGNGIKLYHLQNTGKFFTLSQHKAWH